MVQPRLPSRGGGGGAAWKGPRPPAAAPPGPPGLPPKASAGGVLRSSPWVLAPRRVGGNGAACSSLSIAQGKSCPCARRCPRTVGAARRIRPRPATARCRSQTFPVPFAVPAQPPLFFKAKSPGAAACPDTEAAGAQAARPTPASSPCLARVEACSAAWAASPGAAAGPCSHTG